MYRVQYKITVVSVALLTTVQLYSVDSISNTVQCDSYTCHVAYRRTRERSRTRSHVYIPTQHSPSYDGCTAGDWGLGHRLHLHIERARARCAPQKRMAKRLISGRRVSRSGWSACGGRDSFSPRAPSGTVPYRIVRLLRATARLVAARHRQVQCTASISPDRSFQRRAGRATPR